MEILSVLQITLFARGNNETLGMILQTKGFLLLFYYARYFFFAKFSFLPVFLSISAS